LSDHFYVNRVTNDLDKIRIAGMLCDGKAGKWYETYGLKIDRDMAMRIYGKWVEDPKFMTWDHFEATLRDSHGGWPQRQKDVNKWNSLRQTGGIDAFLDEVNRLTWVMDYPENIVKDKLRDGLKKELRRDWAKVRPKPESVADQMAMIWDLGHADEDFEREEAERTRDQSGRRDRRRDHSSDGRRDNGRRDDRRRDDRRRDGRRSGRDNRSDKSRPGKYDKNSASQSEKGHGKTSGTYQQATRGVDSKVIAARRKSGDCLKCGKSGHSWNDCWAKEPNGSTGSDKRRGDNDSRGSSSFKKPKTSAAAAAVTSEPGRIIEIPEDEDEDMDIWASRFLVVWGNHWW
jgi:hypothetical protein